MATQYNLTGSFTVITEESGTIQNIGYEAAELVSTTNPTEGQGIELLPGEKRTFNGAMKARSKGDTSTKVNVVDFKDAAGGGGSSYVLPIATDSTLGGVKSSSASGDVTVNSDGTMTVNGGGGSSYTLPEATASTLGGVKIGNNISVASDGTISLGQSDVTGALGYTPPQTDTTYSDATQSASGLMSSTDKTKLDGVEASANNYTLPTATDSTLGGVKSSSATGDVTVNDDGTMTVNGGSSYSLPTASASTLGGIKVGSGLSVTADGTLSATGGGGGSWQQVVKLNVTAPIDVKIDIPYTDTFISPPVEVLKYVSGTTDVTVNEFTFNGGDGSRFEVDGVTASESPLVTFDGVVKPSHDVKYPFGSAVKMVNKYYSESAEIDLDAFKIVSEVSLV